MLELTVQEETRKAQLEATIERGLQTFVEVGLALMEIRDGRLYRAEFNTFEEYCRAKWNWTDRHANRMIAAATVTENLGPIGLVLPENVEQTRPLVSLHPDLQREAWREAVDTAPNGKVTGAHVQAVVDRMTEPKTLRQCPYCGTSYEAVVPEHGVTQCPSCSELHSYSGPRDTAKYGPYRQPEPQPEPRTMAHVGQNSGNNEWYTPPEYIEAARDVMGAIDLDPASSEVANAIVGAAKFYTEDDNGLLYDWRGKVWMNPPYAQPAIADFCAKMREEFIAERVTEAIVLVNNATETAWFQSLISTATAVCFPLARIRFWSPDRTSASPLQGQAVVYLGANFDAFIARFMAFGWCAEVA